MRSARESSAGNQLVASYLQDAHSIDSVLTECRIGSTRSASRQIGAQAESAGAERPIAQPRRSDRVRDPAVAAGLDIRSSASCELPGIGTVNTITGKPDDDEMFYQFTSYLSPRTVYRYDLKRRCNRALHKLRSLPVDFSQFETKQVFYTSKDGTRVPMFITVEEGNPLDGNNPTILYALRRIQHLARRLRFHRQILCGWRWAAFTPSRTFVVAENTEKNGMKPECSTRSRTSSTISSRPRNT